VSRGRARLGFHYFNDDTDVERLLAALLSARRPLS
jgi:selenocysteine lyase/cysteine desulfurase